MRKQLQAAILTLAIAALLTPSMLHGLPSVQAGGVGNESDKEDCSVDGRQLTCSRADLLRVFAEAHTLRLESQPRDRVADGQLASFARSLTKEVVPPQSAADITLRLVRTQPVGVSVGSGDVDLATLRVFSTKNGDSGSRLLWVETYHGQADVPWPAVVHALTQQLQGTLAGR